MTLCLQPQVELVLSFNIILFLFQLHILGTSRKLLIMFFYHYQPLSSYSSWGGGSLDLVNRVNVELAQISIDKRPAMCFFCPLVLNANFYSPDTEM